MSLDSAVTSSNAPAFVLKLWKLVEDPSVDDLISWSKEGTAFCVHDPVAFAKEVLPFYFKHSNFTSFVRQLNMYGFKKLVSTEHGGIRSDNPEWEFHHQYFMKGKVDWLENIKRKVHPDEKKVKSEDVSNILEDVKTLRVKHGAVQTQLESLKMENELLWREMSDLRIKHRKQQHVINKRSYDDTTAEQAQQISQLINLLVVVCQRKGVISQKRLAIESVQAPTKRPRMSPPHAQIEELDNVKYLVESPHSASNPVFSLDGDSDGEGPMITVLPDEPKNKSPQPRQSFVTDQVLQTSADFDTSASESSAAQNSSIIGRDMTSQSTAMAEQLPIQVIPAIQGVSTPETSSLSKQDSTSASPVRKRQSTVAKSSSTKASTKEPATASKHSLNLRMPTMVTLTKDPVFDFSPSIFENFGQIFPSDANVPNLVVDDTLQELQNSYDQSNAVVLKRAISTDKDVIDQDVDHINNSLDSLQNLLSGRHYNIDPNLLNQVFDPYDEALSVDGRSLRGKVKVEDRKAANTHEGSDNQDLAPFSPGMFLNDVGEPSNDMSGEEIGPEDNSLLV